MDGLVVLGLLLVQRSLSLFEGVLELGDHSLVLLVLPLGGQSLLVLLATIM